MKFSKQDWLIILVAILISVLPASILKFKYDCIAFDWIKFSEEWSKIILSSTVLLYIAKYIESSIQKTNHKSRKKELYNKISLFLEKIDLLNLNELENEWNKIYEAVNRFGLNSSDFDDINIQFDQIDKLTDKEIKTTKFDIINHLNKMLHGLNT